MACENLARCPTNNRLQPRQLLQSPPGFEDVAEMKFENAVWVPLTRLGSKDASIGQ